ncbi:hypothetical protein WKV44_03345 [Spirochaetia bacterium 38H-sp]|uniref:Uncharacterized protein n=1 Tax=Rarispira pelagica TaxID=3141764 RepID=A0ABU9UA83_9SPIR
MKKKSAFLILLLFLIASCSQSLFITDDSITVSGIDDGSVVGSLFSVNISRTSVSDSKLGLTVSIKTMSSELVSSYSVNLEEGAEVWDEKLTFPDNADPGWYTVDLVFTEDGVQSVFKSYVIFYNPDSYDFSIEYMYVRPSVSRPASKGLVQLSIDIPYSGYGMIKLSYSDGSSVLQDVRSGINMLRIMFPKKEGIYPVVAELYPFVKSGDNFPADVKSPFSATATLVVQDNPSPLPNELKPHNKYYALYHLRGDMTDDASFPDIKIPLYNLNSNGDPDIAYNRGVFGYYLTKNSSFSLELIDMDSENTLPDVDWRLELKALVDIRSVNTQDAAIPKSEPFITANLSKMDVVISVSSDGNIVLDIKNEDKETSYSLGELFTDQVAYIKLYPSLQQDNTIKLILSVNDIPVVAIPVETDTVSILKSVVIIGGSEFSVVLDELAVSSL